MNQVKFDDCHDDCTFLRDIFMTVLRPPAEGALCCIEFRSLSLIKEKKRKKKHSKTFLAHIALTCLSVLKVILLSAVISSEM